MGAWINGRGDANSSPGRAGTRYKDRLEAFGRAVPPGTKISKGLDGPVEENAFPAITTDPPGMQSTMAMATQSSADLAPQSSAQAGGGGGGQVQHVQGVSDGDIEQFMNLDRMEEGFTQNYVGGQF